MKGLIGEKAVLTKNNREKRKRSNKVVVVVNEGLQLVKRKGRGRGGVHAATRRV